MARVIKFRAWNKKDQTMQSWESVRGGQIKWLTNNEELVPLQFTGLLDKNGKEIYEGDILKSSVTGHLYEVRWIDSDTCFSAQTKSCIFYNWEHAEIVGNIYENPELLAPSGK